MLPVGLFTVAATAAAAAGPSVKVIAERSAVAGVVEATLWHDYGTFALYRLPEAIYRSLPAATRSRLALLDERLLFDAQPFNPATERLSVPEGFALPEEGGPGLQLIQFVGPIKEEWLAAVRAAGARPLQYVANQGYLVWADGGARASLAALAAAGDIVQYSAPLAPYLKLGPTLRQRLAGKQRPYNADEVIAVVIQMVRHEDQAAAESAIAALTQRQLSPWTPILVYQNLLAEMRVGDVAALVRRGDITWVGERLPRELYDEVQDQIIAGNLDGGQIGPSGPGYLAFLTGFGFSTDPNDYPVVDVTDDGIGNGTTASGDPTFHETGNIANPTRLAYVSNCTNSANGGGVDGHGHINTSIVGGYDTRSGFPFQDPDGFQRGLGVNPYGRMAGTRIFDPGFDQSSCGGTDVGVIQHVWQFGGRINTNSWGCSGCAGSYDDSSQAYDVGTRDADLAAAGNQELIMLFAAGNSGPGAGTVGTPGNGKNMITVGASENDRPADEDGAWTDGCGIGSTGANNAMDVIGFSSRGPSPGNRKKPEVIAPGTHIQGTASTNSGYTGNSVCDQFRPSGQTTFAASSGTSHSTPAVAGLASLVYWWIDNGFAVAGVGTPPSPAMTKAYLMAHPTYLTGVGANDTLPSNSQGYGMPNMNLLFDDAQKYLLDQTQLFDNTGETWTWSGAVADPTKPVRIALAYTDQAGPIGVSPQINNLNLDATIDGSSYHGNVFTGQWSATGGGSDGLNNYEAIFVQAGASGAIEITVTAANIAGDGVPNTGDGTDQDFALVCYNCVQEPTFTLAVTPLAQQICAPADADYDVTVGSVLGFVDPVDLGASGQPGGTTAGFDVDPVTPPGASQLTISNTGAAAVGSYTIQVSGTSGPINQSRNVGLKVFNGAPAAVTLLTPADGAVGQPIAPAFTWSSTANDGTYTIEIATDAAFTNIVASAAGLGSPSFTPPDLETNTQYYWRVRATNACGTGVDSAVFDFFTEPAAGDCAFGVSPTVFFSTDFESGAAGFTSSGTNNTWALAADQAHSGTTSFKAQQISVVSDQYLVTPPIVVPSDGDTRTLQFWNRQEIEDRTGGCYDGAVLEVSNNGGATWTRLEAELLTDPYNGPISTCCSNPIAPSNAWCGDPQDWLNSIVDIDAYAGQTVQFRFRSTTDSSVSHPGWWVDDVVVRYCSSLIFGDGFETGDTSAWSLVQP
jgi:hypothetical protein